MKTPTTVNQMRKAAAKAGTPDVLSLAKPLVYPELNGGLNERVLEVFIAFITTGSGEYDFETRFSLSNVTCGLLKRWEFIDFADRVDRVRSLFLVAVKHAIATCNAPVSRGSLGETARELITEVSTSSFSARRYPLLMQRLSDKLGRSNPLAIAFVSVYYAEIQQKLPTMRTYEERETYLLSCLDDYITESLTAL